MSGEGLRALASVSLSASVLIAGLLALTPLLRKRYAARWRCAAWLLLAVRLLIPFAVPLPGPATVEIPLPQHAAATEPVEARAEYPAVTEGLAAAEWEDASIAVETPAAAGIEPEVVASPGVALSVTQVLSVVWLAGVAVFVGLHILSYRHFLAALRRSQRVEIPRHIRETLWELGVEMGVCNLPEVVITDRTMAPVLLGLLHPRLLLPHAQYSRDEFAFILRHELVHYRRRDLWYKLILLAANAIHWFNPLVWVMAAQAGKDIELACDDAVCRELDTDARGRYGDAILSALPHSRRMEPMLSTHFGSTKRNIQGRLRNLFDLTDKRRGLAALCALALFAVLLAGAVTFSASAAQTGAVPVIRDVFPVSIERVAAGRVVCVGQIDLQRDQHCAIDLSAESGWGLFLGLHRSPDLNTIEGNTFESAFDGYTALRGRAFSGDGTGIYYVYVGGREALSGIGGTLTVEPYATQREKAIAEKRGSQPVGEPAESTVQTMIRRMRDSYYVGEDSPERAALERGGSGLLKAYDSAGMAWSEMEWDFDTLARFEDLDADLLPVNGYTLYYSVLHGGGDGHGYAVFRLEDGAPQMYSLTTATAIYDLDAVLNTARPLLEQGGFDPASTTATRVRVDLGRRGDVSASGQVCEAIRFRQEGGGDAFYLLEAPAGDNAFAPGELVAADRLAGQVAGEQADDRAFPVEIPSLPGGEVEKLGQIAVTGTALQYSLSADAGHGLFVGLSQQDVDRPKSWKYYSATDSDDAAIERLWDDVTPGTYSLYVGSRGSALQNVRGEVRFAGTVLAADVLAAQPAMDLPAGDVAALPTDGGQAANVYEENTHNPNAYEEVATVDLRGLGSAVQESAFNAADRECVRRMANSGTWGDYVEQLLPRMTPGGVEQVVAIYLERHLFPKRTLPEDAVYVRTTVQNALGYMADDARGTAEEIIASFE